MISMNAINIVRTIHTRNCVRARTIKFFETPWWVLQPQARPFLPITRYQLSITNVMSHNEKVDPPSARSSALEHRTDGKGVVHTTVDDVSEADLSVGAILRGTAVKPLTVFEKKAALINA
jgi:hypothetical protein